MAAFKPFVFSCFEISVSFVLLKTQTVLQSSSISNPISAVLKGLVCDIYIICKFPFTELQYKAHWGQYEQMR